MAGLKMFWSSLLLYLLSQCAPSLQAEAMIFVADYNLDKIYMADFSSDSLDSLTFSPLPLSPILRPLDVDYDPDTSMVYWLQNSYEAIRRGNIDGSDQSGVITGIVYPDGMALDTIRGKVFWTDEFLGDIVSANLNGSSQQVLITNLYRARDIIVHPEERVMFWSDDSNNASSYPSRIERANLDGGDRYVIVNSGLKNPIGLAFNDDGSRIYWCDAGTSRIESVDLWGEDRMVHLATSSIHPYDLVVVDDIILWTDWNYNAIGVTSNDNSSSYSFYYHSVFQKPYGMHVYKGNYSTKYPTSTLQTTTYMEDITTHRSPTPEPATVRLVNGNEPNKGRVEVLYNGVWGTVCSDYWDINDAYVVCRSLGYREALSAPMYAYFGEGSGPIWMDDVRCSGDEAHIFDCPHNGFGNENCGHHEDASVICAPDETDLICDSTSMTLILERSLLEIGDDARDVHFEDKSCVGYNHDSQHVAITTTYDRCGTKQEQDEDYIIFSNLVTYKKPRPENGTDQLITREHYLHVPVTCYLEKELVLGDSFLPVVDAYVFSEEGYGEFSLSLDRYTNAGFSHRANDSGIVELGIPLYFGVNLNSVTNLTLLIESCWATSSPYPLDDHRYDIIENGCAVDSTTYIYNTPSPTFEGFRIDAFTFIGDYDQVYVHCSVLICDYRDSGSRCAQGCLSRARRSLQSMGTRSKPHTITNGPFTFI